MELRCIPFLHDEVNPKMANETCSAVMFKAVTVRPKECVGNLRVMLEDRNAHYTSFPVVSPTGSLLGLVHGLVVVRILETAFKDSDEETFVPLENVMDSAPYTVMQDFPLSRLIPMIRKVRDGIRSGALWSSTSNSSIFDFFVHSFSWST